MIILNIISSEAPQNPFKSLILLPSPYLSPHRGAGGVQGSGVRLSFFTFHLSLTWSPPARNEV